jgi:hypothetical protein
MQNKEDEEALWFTQYVTIQIEGSGGPSSTTSVHDYPLLGPVSQLAKMGTQMPNQCIFSIEVSGVCL